MRTFRDAKAMAKCLRAEMTRRQMALSHAECLEIVAAQFGVPDWNVLAAKIDAETSGKSNAGRSVTFDPAIPILRIFDVKKAKEFYLDFLGFALAWEHRFEENLPLYAEISRSDLTLHLSEHHGDASPGATIFAPMGGIDAFRQELLAKNYSYARPGIEDVPWGRVMQIADPFGNRLRFCERKP